MPLSYVQYTGDGAQALFTYSFNILKKTDLQVRVDNVLQTEGVDYTLNESTKTVTFTVAPASGKIVDIRRNTDRTSRSVNFQDGSLLTETDLDRSADQLFFIQQELVDSYTNTMAQNTALQWDGQGKRLTNLADGLVGSDAATVAQVQNLASNGGLPSGTGHGGKYLRQKTDQTGLEYPTLAQTQVDLGFPNPAVGNATHYLRVNPAGSAFEARTPAQVFADIGLPVPASANAGQTLQVDANGSAYEFAGPLFGFKNLIIGGDFSTNPWQRGTSIAFSGTMVTYTADRWFILTNASATGNVIRSSSVPTVAQAGRLVTESLQVDLSAADTSIAASDYCAIGQAIEGYTFRQIAQKAFTLSFWVYATKTGTYTVGFRNTGSDRSYVAEYTVNLSNTWEFKTITVPASPSDGTWNYTNGKGLEILFVLAAGTNFHTTAGAWVTGSTFSTANQVNALDNAGNDFRLALVQVEAGPKATPFESRPQGIELLLCQRYYEQLGGSNFEQVCVGLFGNTTTFSGILRFTVPKRTAPSLSVSSGSDFRCNNAANNYTTSAVSFGSISPVACVVNGTVSSATSNAPAMMDMPSSNARLRIDAEL